ncbi:MAG: Ig-like domain-containing protein [Bacteroidota bacterium]
MKTITITMAFLISALFASKGQNTSPIAINDTVEVVSQYPIVIDVLANDFDPESDNFSIFNMGSPRHGIRSNVDEKILYKSYAYAGKDSMYYFIRDVGIPPLNSEKAWIQINVLENPDIPVAVSDTFQMVELIPFSYNLLNNDFDPNNDEIKISSISSANGCMVLINEDSLSVTITPFLEQQSARFRYNIIEKYSNDHFLSYYVYDYIYISENPDIPVAVNDSANTIGGIAVDIPVLENDFDIQGDLIEINYFNQPDNGIVVQNNNILSYLPNLSFSGVDYFTYRIREVVDAEIISHQAKVFVTVSKNPNCPIGVTDQANGTTFVPISIDVLHNDYDINGDPLEIMDIHTHGGNAYIDGASINYTSKSTTFVIDSLEYRIRQTNDTLSFSDWTKVYIQLSINPDLPVTVNDSAITRGGMPVNIFPTLNDILNSSDTLILRAAYPTSIKGIVSYMNDSMLTYLPYYGSKGEEVILYQIKDKNNNLIFANGIIYVTIIDQHFFDTLAVSNINAGINANGLLFSEIDELPGVGFQLPGDMEAYFRFPKTGTKSTVFTSSLWFGGTDENGVLHLAGERFKQTGIDFQVGPISNTYDSAFYSKYGRTWKISKQEIDYHKNNFWNQGYQPVEAILNWPGNGNINLGQSQQLAPYNDINNDGIYNPYDGDYPLIRGDQTVFLMYNDDLEHTETGGIPIGIEVHGMVYGFDAPNDSALYNTVFVHYDLINRSSETLYNMHVGVFADLDIGYAVDDYIGCDVTRRSFYAYNGRNIDGDGQFEAYGENPPAQSVTILAGPYMDSDGIDNPTGSCDESVTGFNFGNEIVDDERLGLTTFVYFNNTNSGINYGSDPQIATEYQNYLSGIWRDQSPMLYGGNGHSSSGAVGPASKYLFPGDSDPLNWGTSCNYPEGGYNQQGKFWTEEETGNIPADRRGLGVMGPFTFESGVVQEIELAFCAGMGNAGAISSVNQLLSNIDSLLIAINSGEIILPNSELGVESAIMHEPSIKVFPNPTNNSISVETGILGKTVNYNIFNICGAKMTSGKIYEGKYSNIDVSGLPSGLYIIRFISGNGLFTGKFIKY